MQCSLDFRVISLAGSLRDPPLNAQDFVNSLPCVLWFEEEDLVCYNAPCVDRRWSHPYEYGYNGGEIGARRLGQMF